MTDTLTDEQNLARLHDILRERNTAQQQATELRTQLEEAHTQLTELRTAPIRADDPRLENIWAEAAIEARRRDYCSEYDAIAETVGAPTRDELAERGLLNIRYRVTTRIAYELDLTIEATGSLDAMRKIDDLSNAAILELIADEHGASLDGLDSYLDGWDAREAEEAED